MTESSDNIEVSTPAPAPIGARIPLRWLALAVAAALCVILYVITARPPAAAPLSRMDAAIAQRLTRDQDLFQTATQLAADADTPEERSLAAQAEHLADEVVDTSFALSFARLADQPPAKPTPESTAAAARVDRVAAAVGDDKIHLTALQAALKKASGDRAAKVQAVIAVEQAQLELDQSRLDDARNDASRIEDGSAARLQQLQREHENIHGAAHASAIPAAASAGSGGGLIGAMARAWKFHRQWRSLEAAESAARAAQTAMQADHERLHTRLQASQADLKSGTLVGADRVRMLRKLEQQQQQLARYDQQSDAAGELADTYRQWQPLENGQREQALHGALGLGLWLLALASALLLMLRGVGRVLRHPRSDRRRMQTLAHLLRLVLEVIAALAALVVLFGRPPQLLTVLGLCGAGLTVAFQDAILSFAGWFVLMGRNGMHLGDWVEVNGVVGEVAELRLLKTVLLESGNWITAGHPTGRRVFFPNSFALRGSYFNYSTRGQWLWDEVQMTVPSGADAPALLARVNAMLETEMGPAHARARAEWQHESSTALEHAAPAATLRPSSGDNLLMVVRFATPAKLRTATREQVWSSLAATVAGHATSASAG